MCRTFQSNPRFRSYSTLNSKLNAHPSNMASPPVKDVVVCLSSPTFQDESISYSQIVLQYMPQQDGPEEDWSGLSSAAERRKMQNRLHQRAWRK